MCNTYACVDHRDEANVGAFFCVVNGIPQIAYYTLDKRVSIFTSVRSVHIHVCSYSLLRDTLCITAQISAGDELHIEWGNWKRIAEVQLSGQAETAHW